MSKNFKVGIDYGGTKIEGILMDNEGNEILRKRSTSVSYTHLTLPTRS